MWKNIQNSDFENNELFQCFGDKAASDFNVQKELLNHLISKALSNLYFFMENFECESELCDDIISIKLVQLFYFLYLPKFQIYDKKIEFREKIELVVEKFIKTSGKTVHEFPKYKWVLDATSTKEFAEIQLNTFTEIEQWKLYLNSNLKIEYINMDTNLPLHGTCLTNLRNISVLLQKIQSVSN